MVRLQAVLGMCLESLGQIAGHLHDRDRQALQRDLDRSVPGAGIALGLVGFQHKEVGHRFDSDQTGLGAVEVFIRAQGNGLGCHVRGQLLTLFLIVLAEQLLQHQCELLVCAVGGGNERGQWSQFEETAQGPKASDAELPKDEVQGEHELLEEGESLGRFQEGDQGRGCVGALLSLLPVVQGGVRCGTPACRAKAR